LVGWGKVLSPKAQPAPAFWKGNREVHFSLWFFFVTKPQRMSHPIFFDKKLEIYKDTVVIKDYHVPRFHKRLSMSNIESVRVLEKLTFRTGKYRLGGSQWFGVWLPYHWKRHWRKEALIIRQKRGWIKDIVVTLDSEDPTKACQILQTLKEVSS
jgi:hypothetical protein